VTAANQTQSTFAKELVAAGVDLIIGHHPHVVQTVTVVDGVPVIYSLGNTVFDQYFSSAVQEGMVVALEYTTTKRTAVLHPISSIGSRTRPYLSPAWEKDQFLKALAKLSEVSLEQSIKEGSLSW
jgi:poly-gamma-glutamate synthesis protein (capsule biosynthesis protein)